MKIKELVNVTEKGTIFDIRTNGKTIDILNPSTDIVDVMNWYDTDIVSVTGGYSAVNNIKYLIINV